MIATKNNELKRLTDIKHREGLRGNVESNVELYEIIFINSKNSHYMVRAKWFYGDIELIQVGGTDRIRLKPDKISSGYVL